MSKKVIAKTEILDGNGNPIKTHNTEGIPIDNRIPIPKTGLGFYRVPGSMMLFVLVTGLLTFGAGFFRGFDGTAIIFCIFWGIISFPLIMLASLFTAIKLYLDRRKITTKIITKIAKSYIMADIFLENRRMQSFAYMLEAGGKHFVRNGGIYSVDKECVWLDDANRPHSFYIDDLPNPLKFGFEGGVQEFLNAVRKAALTDMAGSDGINTESYLDIDISYSSTNLALFKKDKFLAELHNPGHEGDAAKYLLIAFVVFSILLIILGFIMRRGEPNITVAAVNATKEIAAQATTVVVH